MRRRRLNSGYSSTTDQRRTKAGTIPMLKHNMERNLGVFSTEEIVTSGLVLHLDAGNVLSYSGSGSTWTDLSGLGNNATLIGGASYSDGAIVFDGSSGYGTVPVSSSFAFGTGDFTVEGWIKITNTTKNYQIMIGTHKAGVGGSGWYYYARNRQQSPTANGQSFGYNTDNQNTQVAGTNVWVHMVSSRISNTLRIYQNAVQGVSIAFTDNIANGEPLTIGSLATASGGGFTFPESFALGGSIGVIRIYKGKGLTQAEVTQNYNALRGRYGL